MVHTRTNNAAEMEHLFGDTIARVADMDERMRDIEAHVRTIPEVKVLIGNISASVAQMAIAAASMADTFSKTEHRASIQDVRFDTLTQLALGRDQIPIESHRRTLRANTLATILPALLFAACVFVYVLYVTKTDIKASLKEIVVNQGKTQEAIQEAKQELQGDAARNNAERMNDNITNHIIEQPRR